MQIKILFNSTAAKESYSTGWGVSYLIDDRILFDTGEKGEYLLNNVKQAGIDLTPVKDIIISHDHWDHTGGLWDLLKTRQDLQVYACPGFSEEFKEKVRATRNRLVENYKSQKVADNVFVTGEVRGQYKGRFIVEQAAVVETERGLTVMTGCAHPGIVTILRLVQEQFPRKKFHAVFGGFHLMNAQPRNISGILQVFKELQVEKAGPTHCSGKETEDLFRKEYGGRFISTNIGDIIDV
jgi:7,8-dihydropterin-6-yl-methyl-4-(beta-D-ribofuranosyl)aminobenzene 5'-phosphate synthase